MRTPFVKSEDSKFCGIADIHFILLLFCICFA